MFPVTSPIGQEVGVEGEKILNQRVTVNLWASLILHLEQANNRKSAERTNGGETPWMGKKNSAAITKTITSYHSDDSLHLFITLPSNHTSAILAFITNCAGSQKAYNRVFSPQISITCHLLIFAISPCCLRYYLLDIFLYLTLDTKHNLVFQKILWKPTASINRKLLHKYTQMSLIIF